MAKDGDDSHRASGASDQLENTRCPNCDVAPLRSKTCSFMAENCFKII